MTPPSHKPLLYLITNRLAFRHKSETDSGETWQSQIEAINLAAQSGVQLIQIREKDLSAKALIEFTRRVIAVARPRGAKVLVNDRLDVALAAKADGVHLRVNSLPANEVRAVVQKIGLQDFLIGVSTHSMAEARAAEAGGADFMVCGPVYDTPSKREYGEPMGLERLSEICRAVKVPVLALGGINLANFREPLNSGAAGIAAISLFTDLARLNRNLSALFSTER